MSQTTFLTALAMMFGTVALVASLRFLRRYFELKNERAVPIAMDGIQERLERIEQAVETTAVEVERISESNRFMAKLLAERTAPAPLASRPERVITPH